MFRQIVSKDSLAAHTETTKRVISRSTCESHSNNGSKRSFSNDRSRFKERCKADSTGSTNKGLGFRKLASNILFSNDRKEVQNNTVSTNEIATSEMHRNMKVKEADYTLGRRTARKLLSEWFGDSKKKTGSARDDEEFALKEKLLLSKLIKANLDTPPNPLDQTATTEPDYHNLLKGTHTLQNNIGILNQNFVLGGDVTECELMRTFKNIIITSIPERTSIPSILAQVYGGPLNKLFLISSHDWKPLSKPFFWRQHIDWGQTAIRLEFTTHSHAQCFWEYSKGRSFLVNGHKLKVFCVPEYPGKSNNRNAILESGYSLVTYMEEPECARRVLVLKKPVENKRRLASRKHYSYPDPNLNYSSEFKIEDIINDFSVFGNIVEVTPVISRKLCFGIQFFDTKAALEAKRSIEGNNEREDDARKKITTKYSNWYVWYGRDPTDNPVIC